MLLVRNNTALGLLACPKKLSRCTTRIRVFSRRFTDKKKKTKTDVKVLRSNRVTVATANVRAERVGRRNGRPRLVQNLLTEQKERLAGRRRAFKKLVY